MPNTPHRSPVESVRPMGTDSDPIITVDLALADLSPVLKVGVKGPMAATWLSKQGRVVPDEIYQIHGETGGTQIVRTGSEEFVIVFSGPDSAGQWHQSLESAPSGVYGFEHEGAVFELSGRRAVEVFAQTCAIDFSDTPARRIIFTRMAGTTCAIIPDPVAEVPYYRLWVDYASAPYLWEQLAQIVRDCGGQLVTHRAMNS